MTSPSTGIIPTASRCDRLLELIRRSRNVLIVRIDRPDLDYRNLKPDADTMQPDTDVTAAALRTRFTVGDYRTGDERAAWAHKRKMKRYARYGATNAFQYRWRRLMAALGGNGTRNA